MANIKIIKGEFEKELALPMAPDIKAGFPSPAGDYLHESLDFNRDLIRHPEARTTDMWRVTAWRMLASAMGI